jgi:predicted amino acid dehydrogenase
MEDLGREYPSVKRLPPERAERWCERSFPTVVELTFRGFTTGLPEVTGWVLLISNTTEQLMNSSKLRKAKILQASRLAAALGAHTVGMAGLIAFFGNGGHVLAESFPQLGFTTGHAYTIANILEIATKSSSHIGLPLKDATVAVVGAAGSIGSGCAKLFAKVGVRRLLLIDIWTDRLAEVAQEIARVDPSLPVECFADLREMRRADLSVVATNSTRRIVEAGFLKPGSIVIDDSFPKNVSETLTSERRDVIALEGGAVRLPRTVEVDRARNLPNIADVPFTRMVSCQEIYGCFAETLTLAVYDQRSNYGLGRSDPALAVDILAKAGRLGIGMAPLQFYGEALNDARVKAVTAARASA